MCFSRRLIWGINLCWPSKLIKIYLPDKCGEQYIVVQNTVPDKDNMSLSKPIYPYGDVMRRVTTGAGFDMIMGKIGSTPTWSSTMEPKTFWIWIINITMYFNKIIYFYSRYVHWKLEHDLEKSLELKKIKMKCDFRSPWHFKFIEILFTRFSWNIVAYMKSGT